MSRFASLLWIISISLSSFTLARTEVFTDKGCITVDENPTCSGFGQPPIVVDSNTATIAVGFPPYRTCEHRKPTCEREFSWPNDYTKVHITAEFCLVDDSMQLILYDGQPQCCTEQYEGERKISPYFVLEYGRQDPKKDCDDPNKGLDKSSRKTGGEDGEDEFGDFGESTATDNEESWSTNPRRQRGRRWW